MTKTQDALLKREECLVLLVDLQRSMLSACRDAERVRERTAVLIDVAEILRIPIVFTEQNPVKLGRFLPELIEKVLEPLVFDKVEFGCFENPSIADAIEASGRKTIILSGIETHICIFQTGLQGLRLDYRVHVASDATSCSGVLNHNVGLNRLERAGAVISSTEMIMFELLKQAGTAEFRKALPIIKKR